MSQWTLDQANAWYVKQPWLVGCNFIPSNAINQLEMWQTNTFDPVTIDRELGWAASIGMNTVRTYLHDLAWLVDPNGFKRRVSQFLDIATQHGIRPLLCIFDDCWNPDPQLGIQPAPRPGIHNSGWVRSPGRPVHDDAAYFGYLESYVKDVLTHFANDNRILLWDLYNEPGNSDYNETSLPLLHAVFDWAWRVRPSQPLTAGQWNEYEPVNKFVLTHSDINSFHDYESADKLRQHIAELRRYERPLICTEWLRRSPGFSPDGVQRHFEHSEVATCLPVFKEERIGCINWGLVAGKTNTIYAWGKPGGASEPPMWFHDLFRQDGTPYREAEIGIFKQITRQSA
jgi:hypothetical protein